MTSTTRSGIMMSACLLLLSALQPRETMAQTSNEITVVSSDIQGMTVEYRPRITRRDITRGTSHFVLYDVPGGGHRGSPYAGQPDVPYSNSTIALPGLVGNTVTIVQVQYHTDTDILMAPVPSVHVDEDGADERFVTGPAYMQDGMQPATLAELQSAGLARDQILANLLIHPVQYDAVRRMARVYDRIVVRVNFGPPNAHLIARGVADPVFGVSALNAAQGAMWRIARTGAAKKQSESPLASGSWYAIEITENGMYRLPMSWFKSAGIDIAGVDPRTIRMFNSGGRELPTDLTAVRPADLQEIAIEVVGESDGRFDDGDYVTFYARGVSGFVYDSLAQHYRHYIHRFDNGNSYLLTFGGQPGKRVQTQQSLNASTPYQPQWFTGREFVEDEVSNLLSSGKLWLSKKLTPGLGSANLLTYTRKLNGIVDGQPLTYRCMFYSASDRQTTNSFALSDNGTPIGTVPMGTVDFNTDRDDIAACSGERAFTVIGSLPDGRSNLGIAYTASDPDRNRGGYVDWIEWHYARKFEPVSDMLAFSSRDTTAVSEYTLNGFTMSDIALYDVTNFADVRHIQGASISGGTVRFQASSEAGSPREYLALAAPAWRTPGAPVKLANSDLLGTTGAEFIIITPPAFIDAAQRLKAHRESSANPVSTRVVSLADIYTEFNSGVKDPTAIRNFLAYAYAQWTPAPKYVLLLGDGHFDYKGYTTKEEIQIPVWESENSINLLGCYVSDDYYACVSGNDERVDLGLGRITAQTPGEAEDAVSKIIHYETGQDFGAWRNRVCFVADDGLTTRGDDLNTHTAQSETVAALLPADIEQKKIYIISYPTENTAQGRRKPDANRAIIDQINDGCVVMNYTGHGSESVWTHEQILVADVSIPQMKNANRLTFIAAATCTFGLYDRPDIRSGMEMMLLKPDGAAIGGLCSPRVVISGQNSVFNETFFENLFVDGREESGEVKVVSAAVWATKQRWYGDPGYEKFHLFGDPTVRLRLPRYRGALDSILVNGAKSGPGKTQLRALSKVSMFASVIERDSSVWSDFNGVSQASLFDAQRYVPIPEWGNWAYIQPGGLLFNGQATITNGRFKIGFIVPKDISYENNTGRLALYFENASVDGAGYSVNLTVGGSDSSAAPDTKGPDISVFLDSRAFQPGDVVNERPLLLVDLYDENGINMTGLGIGHNIEAWIDKSDRSIVLNSHFNGDIDSYQRGSLSYQLEGLAPGTHTLKVRAWDIYNNSTTVETTFRVVTSDQLVLAEVMPYPNPMTDRTTFTFQHNQSEAVNTEVHIFTIAGRLIRKIALTGVQDRFVQVPWDGLDADGDRLANGIYFFKVIVETVDGMKHSEEIGKLAVAR